MPRKQPVKHPKRGKKAQSRTKVGHVSDGFLSVATVAKKLGKSAKTITRWCETGKIVALPCLYGSKATYRISTQALAIYLSAKEERETETKTSHPHHPLEHGHYVDAWTHSMRTGGLNGRIFSERTVNDYISYVKRYFKSYSLVSLTLLKRFLSSFPAHQFATREKAYKAVVCFSKYLIQLDELDKGFIDEAKPFYPKRHRPPKRTTLDHEELAELIKSCESTQDRLIVLLLASTGIRASEACAVEWKDVNIEQGYLTIVSGKGGKSRRLGLNGYLRDVLLDQKENSKNSWVLLNKHNEQMTRHGLNKRLTRLSEKSGVKANPHSLRRCFVTLNANQGRSLVMLQMACGHANIKTTMGYCLTSEEDVIEAMQEW